MVERRGPKEKAQVQNRPLNPIEKRSASPSADPWKVSSLPLDTSPTATSFKAWFNALNMVTFLPRAKQHKRVSQEFLRLVTLLIQHTDRPSHQPAQVAWPHSMQTTGFLQKKIKKTKEKFDIHINKHILSSEPEKKQSQVMQKVKRVAVSATLFIFQSSRNLNRRILNLENKGLRVACPIHTSLKHS